MRNAFALGIAFLVTTGLVAIAQDHNNTTEKAVKAEISYSMDVRVGTTILKAGTYNIQCDRTTITFRAQEGGQTLKMPCKGKELSAPAKETESHLMRDPSGVQVLDKLLLKGSTVEHTFN